MKQENKKVISIRLIYVILFVAIVIGIIFGVRYYKNKVAEEIALAEVEETVSTIARTEDKSTSRSEDLSRNSEENVESEEQISEESNQEVAEEIIQSEETTEASESETEPKVTEETNVEVSESEIVEEAITEPEVPENNYIKISEVTISQGMDLTVRTGLSREDFITLIAGVKQDTSGFFEENAGLIYDLCEEYSLNEIFFCGIISAESGWDIASNHRSTHNYISLMSNGKLISYSSVETGLREAARVLHTNYLTPGGKFYYGKTLSSVKTKFCPASSTWVSLVYGRMSQILK